MRRRGPLVVFEADGLSLRGAVVHVERDGRVRLERLAESRAIEPAAALTDVTEQLRAAGRLPSTQCIVITAEAIGALVRLPVERAQAPESMAQMVRWELEPFLAQQTVARPLGSILSGLGMLSREQVREVLAEQEMRRRQASRDRAANRFGDIARELGHVTDSRIGEALALQARLTEDASADDFACGWSSEPRVPGDEGSPWLVAGMPRRRRQWWLTQLAQRGLRLQALYPLLGCAGAALSTDRERIVVEADRDLVACAAVQRGTVTSLQILPLSFEEPIASVCGELLEERGAREALICGRGSPESVLAGLPSANGQRVALLDPPLDGMLPEGTSRAGLVGLVGAARHALGQVPASAAVRIPARDLGAPLRRRPAFWWAVIAGILVLALGAAEIALAGAHRRAEQDLAEVREPWRRVDAELTRLKRRGIDAKSLRARIARAREERTALQERIGRLEAGPRERAGLLPFLLDALAQSASSEIVLDRLAEVRPGQIRVEGRALTEHAVQAFARAVATRVRGRALRVAAQSIRTDQPGGTGYAFDFSIRPATEEER
jgi:hypothetical protein